MAQPVVGNLSGDELLYARNATVQSVTASAVAVTLLAANLARKGTFIVNDADRVAYIKYGTGASATSYTDKLAPRDADGVGGKHNLSDGTKTYTGIITALWASGFDGTSAARVTELT